MAYPYQHLKEHDILCLRVRGELMSCSAICLVVSNSELTRSQIQELCRNLPDFPPPFALLEKGWVRDYRQRPSNLLTSKRHISQKTRL